ncbi:MAG: hypothetical protein MI923_26945 [Phycisphaerales bacterium]|nr:hypothetical protein [Phycisphaerales bacterium]
MAKRKWKGMTEKEFQGAWGALPEKDRRFLWTTIAISQIIDDPKLRYRELSARWNRALGQADRNTLGSIVVECVSRLIDNSVLPRVKKIHRQRAAKRRRST